MLKIKSVRRSPQAMYADEYRELQRIVTRLSGQPPPPCYYCTATQIWSCSRNGKECGVFARYCAKQDFSDDPSGGTGVDEHHEKGI